MAITIECFGIVDETEMQWLLNSMLVYITFLKFPLLSQIQLPLVVTYFSRWSRSLAAIMWSRILPAYDIRGKVQLLGHLSCAAGEKQTNKQTNKQTLSSSLLRIPLWYIFCCTMYDLCLVRTKITIIDLVRFRYVISN